MAPGGGKGGALMARLDDFIVKELSKGGEVFCSKTNLLLGLITKTIWFRSPYINGVYMIALRLCKTCIYIYTYICIKTSVLQKLKGVLLHLTAFVVCFGIL